MKGSPILNFWETVLSLFETDKNSPMTNVPFIIAEDNEAAIKIIRKGRCPTMRHINRTHRVAMDWLYETCARENVIIKHVNTRSQAADILTKHFTRVDQWSSLCKIINRRPKVLPKCVRTLVCLRNSSGPMASSSAGPALEGGETAGDHLQGQSTLVLAFIPWLSTNAYKALNALYPFESIGASISTLFLPEGATDSIVAGNYMKWMTVADNFGKTIARHFESYPLLAALQQGGPTPQVFDNVVKILRRHNGFGSLVSIMSGTAGDRVLSADFEQMLTSLRTPEQVQVQILADSSLALGRSKRGKLPSPASEFQELCAKYGYTMQEPEIRHGATTFDLGRLLVEHMCAQRRYGLEDTNYFLQNPKELPY